MTRAEAVERCARELVAEVEAVSGSGDLVLTKDAWKAYDALRDALGALVTLRAYSPARRA